MPNLETKIKRFIGPRKHTKADFSTGPFSQVNRFVVECHRLRLYPLPFNGKKRQFTGCVSESKRRPNGVSSPLSEQEKLKPNEFPSMPIIILSQHDVGEFSAVPWRLA
jgi:hypothetical protein